MTGRRCEAPYGVWFVLEHERIRELVQTELLQCSSYNDITRAMTQQIQDVVILEKDQFILSGWDGVEPPFDPQRFDLEPQTISTACWRGWHAALRINNRCLTLDSLHIGLPEEMLANVAPESSPQIFGKPLMRYEYRCQVYCETEGGWVDRLQLSSEARATDIGGPIMWDGKILLGSDPRPFAILAHPAWYYRTIIECEFVRGVLVGQWDRSSDCQRISDWCDSEACPKPPADPFGSDRQQFRNWERGLDALMGALFRGVYCKSQKEDG